MTFTNLVRGDVVLVDANIFVYHFAPDPVLQVPCGQRLQRIENQEIRGCTSTHTTRPFSPTARASGTVKNPIPGPTSRTLSPGLTKAATRRSGFSRRRRIGLASSGPSHQGTTCGR